MRLKYEPSSQPLHISAIQLVLQLRTVFREKTGKVDDEGCTAGPGAADVLPVPGRGVPHHPRVQPHNPNSVYTLYVLSIYMFVYIYMHVYICIYIYIYIYIYEPSTTPSTYKRRQRDSHTIEENFGAPRAKRPRRVY